MINHLITILFTKSNLRQLMYPFRKDVDNLIGVKILQRDNLWIMNFGKVSVSIYPHLPLQSPYKRTLFYLIVVFYDFRYQ